MSGSEDETAKTSLIYDASGAKQGAADLQDASDKIIAADAAVAASGDKTAATVTASSAAMATAIESATNRIATSTSSQTNFLNRLQAQLDPLGAAFIKASDQMGTLLDIAARGGPNAERALSLIGDATDALLSKFADLDGAQKNIAASMDAWTAKYAPAAASAQKMVAEIADLNAAVKAGVEIQGGYNNALDDIIAKYDEGAQAAKQFNEQQQQLIATARDAQNAQNSQSDFNTVLGVNPTSGAGSAASSAAVFQEIDQLTAKFAPAAAAAQQMQNQIDQLNRAVEVGIDIEGGYDAALAKIALEYDTGAQSALKMVDAQNQLIASARDAQTALNAQNNFNTVLGVNPTSGAGSAAASAAAFQENFDQMAQQAKTIENLTNEFNPLLAATAEYQAALARINQAVELDIISETQAEAAREKATTGLTNFTNNIDKHVASTGQADFATRQLGVQTIQFFTSVEGGQPLLNSFIQQFHQVIDVQVATGTTVAQLGEQVGKVFASIGAWVIGNPLVVGIVAITTATAALGIVSEIAARQAETLQDQLRATRTDYAALSVEVTQAAKDIAATTNISTADARSAGQTIASAPNFNGTQAQLETLITTSSNLAKVMGTTVTEAAKELATALQDPGNEAEALATRHFPGMTQALADSIKQMSDSGDKADAFAKVLAVLQSQTSSLRDAETPLETALHNLSDAFTKTGQDGRSWANVLGDSITVAAAAAVNAVGDILKEVHELWDYVTSLKAPPTSGATPSQSLGSFLWDMTDENKLAAFIAAQIKGGSGPAAATAVDASIAPFITQSAATTGIDPELLARLQNAEGVLQANGQWQTSPSGAVGPMQVMPSLFAGMQQQPGNYPSVVGLNNLSNPQQNVTAGAAYFAHLLNKYGDPSVAVLAYHDGETAVDAILNSQPGAQASQAGLDEVNKVLAGYTGTGFASLAANAGGTPPLDAHDAASATNPATTAQLQSQIDAGTVLAKSINDLDAQIAENQAKQAALQQAIAAAQQLGQPDQVAADTKALAELQGQALSLVDAQTKLKQSAEDQLAPLQAQAGFARDMATIENNAALAARAHGQAIDQVTLALTKQSEQIKLASQFNDLVTATNQQTDAQLRINAAFDGTQDSLTHAQNAEKAYAQSILDFAPGSQQQIDKAAQYTAALDAGSAATESLQQHQQALSDLSGAFSQAFDQIGQAITNSLVQGTGAAVNWGNVMTAVAQQVLQEFLKLAVLNPLLNELFGQHNTTLSGALGALTGGGTGPDALTGALGTAALAAAANGQASGDIPFDLPGSTGSGGTGGGGILGTLSNLGTVGSVGNSLGLGEALGLTGPGGALTNLGSSLGLTGPNGILSSLGIGGNGGVLSSITNLLSTPLLGTGALTSGTTDALANLGPGVFGPATASEVGLGGVTIGSALSGVGGGFTVGSLAGNAIQSSLDKTGPAPTIGAGVGALSGAAIGSIIPGIGTVIGGIIGGLLGGSGGGLIGPHPASPFSSTTVSSGLQEGATVSQLTDTSQEVSTLNAQLAQISAFLAQSGLSETQPRTIQIGQNSPGGGQDDSKFSDLFTPNESGHSAFNEESFTSQDPTVNSLISTRSYADLQTLQTVFTATSQFVQDVSTSAAATTGGFSSTTFFSALGNISNSDLAAKLSSVDQFLTQIVPTLSGLNLTTSGSLNDAAYQVSQSDSLADAFPSLRFQSNNSDENQVVSGRSFADPQTLTTVVTALNQFVSDVAGSGFNVTQYLAGLGGVANSDLPTVLGAVDTFVTQTVPGLLDFNKVTGSLNDTITQITAQFATAIDTAGQLDYQEQALTATRDAAIAAAEDAVRHSADLQSAATNAQTLTTQASLNSGTIGGSVAAPIGAVPGAVNDNVPAAEAAALATFDVQRQTQIEQLQAQYKSIFGDAYATTQEYIENSVALEASLGTQRLAIQKQYNDSIEQAQQQINDQTLSYKGQYLTSAAQISGNPADTQSAALFNFDAQAQQQLEQLQTQFKGLYGDLYAQTTQYAQESTALEASLGEQRLAIQKQYSDQLAQTMLQANEETQGFQGQYLTAEAQISGTPQDAETAALFNFDLSAKQQGEKLTTEYQSIFGNAFASTTQYAQASAALEKSLGAQRLAIQSQYNTQISQSQQQAAQAAAQVQQQAMQQAAQSVTSVITSLKTYALSLQQGAASPLSLKDQYSAASNEFDSVSSAALNGNFNSLSELQTYAQALQQASQAVYGSGATYASDIARIESVLSQVAQTSTDTLTAEAFTAQIQTQTQTLSGDLGDLKDLLSQMLSTLKQAGRAPAVFSAAA